MEIFDAITGRRSIRKFASKAVPKEVLLKILDAARWAPSACNRQLWEFVVVTDHDTKRQIADNACFKQKFLKEAPTLIVVFYDDTKERREESGPRKHDSIQSAAAAIQNMNLAAYALGIGSLWVCSIKNMMKLNKILRVPKRIRPVAIVALGYPRETPEAPPRRPLESLVHYEKFQQLQNSYPNSTDPRKWSLNELATFRGEICWYGGTIDPEFTLEKYNMESRAYQKLMAFFEEYDTPKSKVLDILPFGGGYLVGLLKRVEDPKRIHCFELSGSNVRFIRQNLKTFALSEPIFHVNRGNRLRIESEDVDLVTCFFRLEKLPDPEAMLAEIHRVLKDSGHVLLATELRGMGRLGHIVQTPKRKNLHTSRLWSTGPSVLFSKGEFFKMITLGNFKIIHQELYREDGWIKSIGKQIARSEGVTLLALLEKT